MGTAVRAIVVVLVIAALAGGGYLVFHKSNSETIKRPPSASSTNKSSSTSSSSAPSETTKTSASVTATISFTGSNFTPSVTTVKAGDTVQVTNNSNQELDFDSDPHPAHTDEPELNLGPISPSESKTFTVTKTGHWGFHDHLNPSITGTLDVE